MNSMTEMPAPLVFTDSAAEKVRLLIEEEGNAELKLRVFVSGGGCSGFQYRYGLAETIEPDDIVTSKGDVRLVVDPVSLDLIEGSEVDFVESLGGSAFRITNPQAASGCGCGASFSV